MSGCFQQGEDGTGMELRHLSPAGIRPPFGRYHHLVEANGAARLLFLSGQLGIRPDGTVPEEVAAQTAQAFANIDACLVAADFTRAQVAAPQRLPHRGGVPPGLHAGPRRLGRRPAPGLHPCSWSRLWRCPRARSRSKPWPPPDRCGCSTSTVTRCRRATTAPCARWRWPGSRGPATRSTCATSTMRVSIRC